MGLLRNASGLIIPSSTAGRSGRADDPEFHISRLNHFGQGMGIDVASTHHTFSGKNLASFEGHDDEEFSFNSHDEGLQLPMGHIDAARSAINNSLPDHMEDLRKGAVRELDHRRPYIQRVHTGSSRSGGAGDLSDIRGTIYKDTHGPTPGGHPSRGILGRWGQEWRHLPASTHKDAIKDISSRFQEFNRNRTGPSADVANLVSSSINNPNEQTAEYLRREVPSIFSSQFLGIMHFPQDESKEFHDHIDLKTGTWAKIDPEGYFPDYGG